MALTQFQLSLLFAIVFIAIGVLLLLAFWISRKYPRKGQKRNPVVFWLIILLVLFMAHLSLVVFGVTSSEQLQDSIKYYIIAFLLIVGMYFIKALWLDRPIPTEKLLERYVMPAARSLYGASVYRGTAAVPRFLFSKVVPSGYNLQSKAFQDEGVDLMEVFLVRLAYGGSGTIMDIMMIRDKFTGEGLENIRNPTLDTINQWLGREAMHSYEERMRQDKEEEVAAKKE